MITKMILVVRIPFNTFVPSGPEPEITMPTNLPQIPWSLLIDGSALFFGQRAVCPEKNLDYLRLGEILSAEAGSSVPPKPAFFFTAFQESNDKQLKFNDMIRNELSWKVQALPHYETTVANPLLVDHNCKLIRFDSMIAYCMGRIAEQSEKQSLGRRAFVVSDSWALAGPVRDCLLRGTPITIVFFGQVIDTRWHRFFKEMENQQLKFVDLDSFADRLFSRARLIRKRDDQMLPDLDLS